MRARPIAPAFTSVYAVSRSIRLQLIERGPDGFWGPWRATGTPATRAVHLGSVVAVLGPDGRVSAQQRHPAGEWHTWTRPMRELAATYIPGRGPVVFAVDGESVWHAWKESPSTPWREWEGLGDGVTSVDATVIPGGGLTVFGIRDGIVLHRWQDRPLSTWHDWTDLDAPAGGATALCAGTITDGGLVVFALGGDGAVHHRWQNQPFDRWQPWVRLGGSVRSLVSAKTHSGGLAVFGIGLDDRVSCRYQSRPFGEWSDWVDLGRTARSIAAQASYTDGLEVFALGMDDEEISHAWCERLGAPWREWTRLDLERSPLRTASGPPARTTARGPA
jgi:hypothetical protein